MEKKKDNDNIYYLTLSVGQELNIIELEASASVSQGFEAVDSPESGSASFSARPQESLQRLLP